MILRRVSGNEMVEKPYGKCGICCLNHSYLCCNIYSEFVMSYENLLSDSGWASFIISQNMKFVGIGMIGVAIIVDTLSALRRKRYDEYQIVLLEKVFLFNGLFTVVLFPLSLVVLILAPMYFVETIFALILFQWGVMAITELLYLITNYKV